MRAAFGFQGLTQGIDYRGVPVIAAIRAIPDSPWFLVARIDLGEVLAPVRERGWIAAVLSGAILLAAGAAIWLALPDAEREVPPGEGPGIRGPPEERVPSPGHRGVRPRRFVMMDGDGHRLVLEPRRRADLRVHGGRGDGTAPPRPRRASSVPGRFLRRTRSSSVPARGPRSGRPASCARPAEGRTRDRRRALSLGREGRRLVARARHRPRHHGAEEGRGGPAPGRSRRRTRRTSGSRRRPRSRTR